MPAETWTFTWSRAKELGAPPKLNAIKENSASALRAAHRMANFDLGNISPPPRIRTSLGPPKRYPERALARGARLLRDTLGSPDRRAECLSPESRVRVC